MTNERELAPTQLHPSWFERFRYVYPVVSRRAGGVSIGVNLSPTKRCNFRCVYCQVERSPKRDGDALIETAAAPTTKIELDVLAAELWQVAKMALDGELFRFERFVKTPPEKRVLRDFALSGDGEPTLSSDFGGAVDALVDVRKALELNDLALVLITNATRLQAPEIVAALDRFVENGGKIWAKLDAGDDERLRTIDRTTVPLAKILENIEFASRRWGVSIQTAALSWNGASPSADEIERYCDCVRKIVDGGGKVESVQLYTVARIPAESAAAALPDAEMEAFAAEIRRKTGLRVDVFLSK